MVKARLDRKGGVDGKRRQRVLCGRENAIARQYDCGGELAYVTQLTQNAGLWTRRDLIIPPGWLPRDDSVWKLTTYAQRRVEQGKEPKFRQGYARAEDRKKGERPFHRGVYAKHMTQVECPKCGQLNDLDHEVLEIGTFYATGEIERPTY